MELQVGLGEGLGEGGALEVVGALRLASTSALALTSASTSAVVAGDAEAEVVEVEDEPLPMPVPVPVPVVEAEDAAVDLGLVLVLDLGHQHGGEARLVGRHLGDDLVEQSPRGVAEGLGVGDDGLLGADEGRRSLGRVLVLFGSHGGDGNGAVQGGGPTKRGEGGGR